MFKSSRILATVVATVLVVAGAVVGLPIAKVSAAGLATTITPSALVAATPTDVTFAFTPSVGFAAADTVTITASTGLTITNTCTTPTTDSAAPAGADGSASVTGQVYTYTYTGTTTLSTLHSYCIKASGATGIYSLVMTNTKGSWGGALVYIGNANVVTVSASVNPSLAFQIVQTGNINASTNVCALGTLTLAAVNTCDYRLKVTTNSETGYTISVTTDGDLRRSGSGDVATTEDIDRITTGTAVTAGTEGYGVNVTAATITGTGAETRQGGFATPDTQLPFTVTSMLQSTGTNNPTTATNTSLVTHKAAINGVTGVGSYLQAVTYTVTASF